MVLKLLSSNSHPLVAPILIHYSIFYTIDIKPESKIVQTCSFLSAAAGLSRPGSKHIVNTRLSPSGMLLVQGPFSILGVGGFQPSEGCRVQT